MKILIATDGSEFSDAAVEKTCEIIKNAENAVVKIISAFEQPLMVAASPYGVYPGGNPVLENDLKGLSLQAIANAEEYIRKRFPDLKQDLTARILHGSPGQMIVAEAEKWGADLIVVGSHGYGFLERVFLGSVSDAVIHHAPCSVMVVRKPAS